MSMWKFAGTCADSEPFQVAGLDVWSHEWIRRDGESAAVVDPLYGQPFTFSVYDMAEGENRVTFAAGEFSNCVWGFYRLMAD